MNRLNKSENFLSSIESSLSLLEKGDLLRVWSRNYNDPSEEENSDFFRKELYLFEEEFIPTSELFSTDNSSIIEDIMEAVNNGTIPPKNKKLKKLYNILVYVGKVDGKITYQSIDNLNAELTDIILNYPELKTFFNDVLGIISIDEEDENNKSNIATEFLRINGHTQNMLKTDRISIYSALLNYPKSLMIENDVYQNIIPNSYRTIITTSYINDNWEELTKQFKQFMDQLLVRTINYSN